MITRERIKLVSNTVIGLVVYFSLLALPLMI